MIEYVNIRWEEGEHAIIAKLPKLLFKEFVKKNCMLCKMARDIEKELHGE